MAVTIVNGMLKLIAVCVLVSGCAVDSVDRTEAVKTVAAVYCDHCWTDEYDSCVTTLEADKARGPAVDGGAVDMCVADLGASSCSQWPDSCRF